MATRAPQTYENHAKLVPLYHGVAFLILVVNFFWTLWRVARDFSFATLMGLLVAAALLIIWSHVRMFVLTVQDRVIRLEMRLRLHQILPDDLKPRIGDFTVAQLIGLRFAGDAELPGLARKVLAEGIDDRKAIKKLVKDWQGDYLRA